MKKLFFLAAAALTALVACNREPAPAGVPASEIKFTSNLENTYAVKAATLEGKTVRIVAGAPVSASTDATASGTALTPATPMHWKAGQTEKTTFVAFCPGNGETDMTIAGYSLVDATGAQDFDYHNDFLVAAAKNVDPGTTVALNFAHPFVKLAVNVDNQLTGTPEVTAVAIKDVYLEGDIAEGVATHGTATGVVPGTKNSAGAFEAIIMPAEQAKPVIMVTTGTTVYTFKINAAIDLVAGKSYTATLTLKDTTPVVVDGDEVAFTFTVTDWDAVADPLAFTDISEQWSVIGNLNGDNWATDIVMTENATTHLLEADITYLAGDEFKLRKALDWVVQAGLKAAVTYVGDGAWDGYLDGDKATNKNIKLAAAGEYKLTFNPTTYEFTATKTGDAPTTTPTTNKFTLNVYDNASYGNMNLYLWVIGEPVTYPCGGWPGQAAAATDVVVAGNTYKSFVVEDLPLNSTQIYYILNNGAGKQTADANLAPLTSADETRYCYIDYDNSVKWIDDPATFTPPAAPAGEVWVLVGLSNDWGTEHVMSEVAGDADAREVTITLGASTEAEGVGFKFRPQGDTGWTSGKQFGGNADGTNIVIDATTQGDTPVQLSVDTPSSGNIALTPIARQYKLKLYVDGTNKGKLYVTLL